MMGKDNAKIRAVVHYVCRKMATDPGRLGKTKLHKILWWTDVKAYRQVAKTVTGGSYARMPFGPCFVGLDDVLEELTAQGLLYVDKAEVGNYEQYRLIGKGQPNTTLLSEKELRWLDSNIEWICYDHTAGSISEKTHGRLWEILSNGEEMPIEAMVVRFMKPRPETVEWARRELGIA